VLQAGESEIDLGQVEIGDVARLFEQPQVQRATDIRLGDALRLRGYSLETHADRLHLDLVWYAVRPVTENYTVFVHIVNQDGQIIEQRDAMPQENQYPTSLWVAGEYVTDSYDFSVPAQAFSMRVGLYLADSGVRLPVFSSDSGLQGDYVELVP
jgi:hypothetical protein